MNLDFDTALRYFFIGGGVFGFLSHSLGVNSVYKFCFVLLFSVACSSALLWWLTEPSSASDNSSAWDLIFVVGLSLSSLVGCLLSSLICFLVFHRRRREE